MTRSYDQREITLAAAILNGLTSRGEFGSGAFDKIVEWEPNADGDMDSAGFSMDPQSSMRLLGLVVTSLSAARTGIEIAESGTSGSEGGS